MPPRSKLSLLPANVLTALDERLRTRNFSDFVQHAWWLDQLGHKVGKSAIHAYAQKHRERITAGLPPKVTEEAPAVDHAINQRIECLKIAKALDPAARRPSQLFDAASALYQWATRPA